MTMECKALLARERRIETSLILLATVILFVGTAHQIAYKSQLSDEFSPKLKQVIEFSGSNLH